MSAAPARRPQTSIKYAGMPWEMGLSEAHQVLTLNSLRHRVLLRTDGGLKTGRDVVIAAMLGAEEFGIGTASLIAMGCIMVRQCHSNTCPVGVCTQDRSAARQVRPARRRRSSTCSASSPRRCARSWRSSASARCDEIDRPHRPADAGQPRRRASRRPRPQPAAGRAPTAARARCIARVEGRNEVPDTLDAQMIRDAAAVVRARREDAAAATPCATPTARSARGSSPMITRKFGMAGLQPDTVTVRLRGSAGQSLGAFAVQGLKLEVFGDANDYVGKGLSGGTIVVRPTVSSAAGAPSTTRSSATPSSTARPRASCSPRARRASASPCATPAPTRWSKAAAPTAANT